MQRLFLVILLFFTFIVVKAQQGTTKVQQDSVRLNNIENELRDYGKQSFLTDKITLIQFIVVVCGTIAGIPALPLLLATSTVNLIIVIINWRADKKLSEFNKKKYKIYE
jgi:Na+/H+ antiporter NhaC